ncbi:HpcH/HpaI aldolase/citrate lyase family protein [Baekduia soli]|uniref:HpcH/HpaI aldolase/citrate lyase family protein n=1 Tax=Baekduia soli TaxID=496014 RepID=UPI001651E30E|nr:CoA ester lyase [Baekduia soli]
MIDWTEQLLRSVLFVPGIDERKLAKVGSFGADAIVIDLEDAVADDQKIAARQTTRAAVPTYGDAGAAVVVRVNGITTGRMEGDIEAVVTPGLDAMMVPKVEDVETLPRVDELLADAERAAGIEVGTIRVLGLLETPKALAHCEEILAAAPPRVHTAVFGAGDYTTELGIDLTRDATEILWARCRLVNAVRAAGLAAPIDGPWLALEDVEGLEADCRRARGLGYQGRVTVYPPQVEVVLRAYSALTDEEEQRARQVIEEFEEALARDVASIRIAGRFVDYPIYRLAKARIARLDTWRARTEVAS